MRILSCVLFVVALVCALVSGIMDWRDMADGAFRVDIAILLAGALVALAVIGDPKTMAEKLAFVPSVAVFGVTVIMLISYLGRLDKLEFDKEPIRPFAVIMAGCLISFAISSSKNRNRPSEGVEPGSGGNA
jgi:branched-subunit amino acid ABC-type transport system permease component